MRHHLRFSSSALFLAILVGAARPAFARRGGWSQDPYWWRIEVSTVAIVLFLSVAAFGMNGLARWWDKAARARIEKVSDSTNVDDCLKDL
jgi:hypothetical protein